MEVEDRKDQPQEGDGALSKKVDDMMDEEGEATVPPRFEIRKWHAVAMWSWDICADTCAICRNSLNEPSIEYQASPSPNNENGLSIAFGSCAHVFHMDCIQRWLKTRSVCPLCNKEWDFSKVCVDNTSHAMYEEESLTSSPSLPPYPPNDLQIEKIPGYGTVS